MLPPPWLRLPFFTVVLNLIRMAITFTSCERQSVLSGRRWLIAVVGELIGQHEEDIRCGENSPEQEDLSPEVLLLNGGLQEAKRTFFKWTFPIFDSRSTSFIKELRLLRNKRCERGSGITLIYKCWLSSLGLIGFFSDVPNAPHFPSYLSTLPQSRNLNPKLSEQHTHSHPYYTLTITEVSAESVWPADPTLQRSVDDYYRNNNQNTISNHASC